MARLFCIIISHERRLLTRRIIVAIGVAISVIAVLWLSAIAIPIEYRAGVWKRRVPVLDHRLLPHLSALFSAAFGAFFGSISAFYLGRRQQKQDRNDKRHSALIAAQYALMSQWNIVEEIRVGHLEEFRSLPDRFVKLPLFHFDVTPTFVPFSELTFLLETTNPNLLQGVHLAEQSYQTCVNALKLRNQELSKFYENPRLSHHLVDFQSGRTITRGDPKEVLILSRATDALSVCVDRTLPRLMGTIAEIEKARLSLFPDKTPLPMVRDSDLPDTKSSS